MLSHVAVVTCPSALALQVALVWAGLWPAPCVQQYGMVVVPLTGCFVSLDCAAWAVLKPAWEVVRLRRRSLFAAVKCAAMLANV